MMQSRSRWRSKGGFLLVEMAVVLAILGIVAGGTIVSYRAVVQQKMRSDTFERLAKARQALLYYGRVKGRLPYADNPAAPNGYGDAGLYEGVLPFREIGIEPWDAWSRAFNYEVNSGLVTGKAASCNTLTSLIDGSADTSAWSPKVWDASREDSANPLVVTAVILSGGEGDADGGGSVFDAIYDAGPPAVGGDNVGGNPYLRHAPADSFDDIVTYLGAPTLYDWVCQ